MKATASSSDRHVEIPLQSLDLDLDKYGEATGETVLVKTPCFADDMEENKMLTSEALAERVAGLKEVFASTGIDFECSMKRMYRADSDEGRERLKKLGNQRCQEVAAMIRDDPGRNLCYPEDGTMQQLIDICYIYRRKLLISGTETGRDTPLRIMPPMHHLVGEVLNDNRTIDLTQFRNKMIHAGHNHTIEIEGATPDATITPGIVVADGTTVKLRNVIVVGSKGHVFGGDGTALSPLRINTDADVDCENVVIRACDEMANPTYCVIVDKGAHLRLQNCDLTDCHQEFALCAQEESRLDLVSSKIAGVYSAAHGNLYLKHCDIAGNPKVSATGIFALYPVAVELVDNRVHDFRHTGVEIQGNPKPDPCTIERNKISNCGEFGARFNEKIANRSAFLRSNSLSDNAWGNVLVSEPRDLSFFDDKQIDHASTRNGQVRQQLQGKYCDGCIELMVDSKKAERGDKTFEYFNVQVLDLKGAVLGFGTVPITVAAQQGVFLFGDAGVCEVDSRGVLLGIRWDNEDFWQKGGMPTKKIATKVAVKTAADQIKKRKAAAKKRERAAGPDPDRGGYAVQHTASASDNRSKASSTRADSAGSSVAQPAPKEEEKKPDATQECVVCLTADTERPVDWIFSACGHRCLCKRCARKLRLCKLSTTVECPLCRTVSEIVPMHAYKGEKVFDVAA